MAKKKVDYQGSLADYKASIKKTSSGSDGDVKYTKDWYNTKIEQYSNQLAKAKVEMPYMVKDLEKDIAKLKYEKRYASIKLPPSNLRSGAGGVGRGEITGVPGGGLRKHGR